MISFSEASDAEPRSQIFSRLRDSLTSSKLVQWANIARGPATHEHIVRLEVRMKDVAFPQEAQTQEHLLCVRSDRSQIYAHVSPKFL